MYRHRGPQIYKLMTQLHDMPERAIMLELHGLDVALYIYGANAQQLRGFLDFVRKDPSNYDLGHMTSINKQRDIRYEIARLLQNHVASVRSLVDHTREQARRLWGPNVLPEYETKVTESFRDEPLVQFVQCLRNILLHSVTAPLAFSGKLTDEEGPVANEVGLNLAAIAGHKRWLNSKAKSFLRSVEGDVIDLPTVIDQYHLRVTQFYQWYQDRLREMHASELERYRQLEQRITRMRIEDTLNLWFENPDPVKNHAPADRGLLLGVLDVSEFELLESLPCGSPERADLAIHMLKNRMQVGWALERVIRRAYADPNFFRFRDFRPSEEY